jgi:hypothetical protein
MEDNDYRVQESVQCCGNCCNVDVIELEGDGGCGSGILICTLTREEISHLGICKFYQSETDSSDNSPNVGLN